MTNYSEKICEACQPDADPAKNEEIIEFLSKNSDWSLIESDGAKKIERIYKFKNFGDALEFTNLVGEVAEIEGHHPQIITEWGSVLVRWWSHKIGNIHLNDLILAARCDQRFEKLQA
ncbi:4a-hydroxytetrahydrobiopterin dehydratase [Paracoccaceae bacterium]|nr:4a-hydroxytetrahydrobiopterin dehydratase [Paracoccaceae bacterium]